MNRSALALLLATTLSAGVSTAASAQSETTLITPAIPDGFDRGRNVSVIDRPRPDFDPLGIPLGAFLAYPSVTFGLGASSNVFLTDHDKRGDIFGTISPEFRLTSNWNKHQLTLLGGGIFQHYFKEHLRDQNAWYVSALGRVDVTSDFTLSGDGGVKKTYESPFSGEVDSNQAVLSSYYLTNGSIKGTYVVGRGRFIATYDNQDYDFRRLRNTGGGRISQAFRDRDINRFTGQVEYALSPEVSAYVQGSYSDTDYGHRLPDGSANRDSHAYRILGGVNFDLTSLIRGSVGAGYVRRNYRVDAFKDVGGFSVEASVEYFPTELTTVTAEAHRVLEDSNLGGSIAYFDNRASLRIDHELLTNLILNLTGEVARQNYVSSNRRSNDYELGAGARYLLSHTIALGLNLAYRDRKVQGDGQGVGFNEFEGQLSLTIQR